MDNVFRPLLLIFVWFLLAWLYILVSKRERSYLNIITPFFMLATVKTFFLEVWRLFRLDMWGSDVAFVLVVIANGFYIGAFIFSFILLGKRKGFVIFHLSSKNGKYWVESLVFLILCVVFFFPIYKEFGNQVFLDSRYVYTQTRTGWGIYYFVSAFFAYFSLVFCLYSIKPKLVNVLCVAIFYSLLLFFLGSKGKVLGAWTIIFIWYLKQFKPQFSLKMLCTVFALILPLAAILVSGFTTGGTKDLTLAEKVDFAAMYADYSKNESLVIDDKNMSLMFGKMMFEEFFVSKIPRVFYQNKPKDFGQFYLAEKYYPDRFDMDTGSPSFGKAMYFVDFGYLALFVIALFSFASGLFACMSWNGILFKDNPYNFIVACTFNGVSFIAVGVGSFLIETVLFLMLVYFLRFISIPKPKILRFN